MNINKPKLPNKILYIFLLIILILGCKKETDFLVNDIFTSTDNKIVLTTSPIIDILETTATCGGDITSDSTMVTTRGVCWNTNKLPTIVNSHSNDGTGGGSYISKITGLTANTYYYVRAFATNNNGITYYGAELSFITTPPTFLPTITTSSVSNITVNTAISGGNITSNGGSTITARGVCWSLNHSPTILNSHTSNGTGSGGFTSNITGLNANKTYYVRAYATNNVGTAYGSEVSFATIVGLPEMTTVVPYNITYNTAKSGGIITSIGGSTITDRGACWSTSHNPTISSFHISIGVGSGSGLGSFSCDATGLLPLTTYYIRSYSANSAGIAYGDELSFTTATNFPTITTTAASNITYNTAESGGVVNSAGGATVTARGVCWSTNQNPTITNSHTSDGSGTGYFSSNITGLSALTTYYIRAYATNSFGTSYGTQFSFTTINNPYSLPSVTTTAISNITYNSAISGGNVTSDGGTSVTVRGVCWNTSSNPTISNSHTTNNIGLGVFTSNITSLIYPATYFLRAYATNSVGTSYGNEIVFTVGLGGTYQGGVIAYILQTGDPGYVSGQIHGLIASTNDQSTSSQWGCYGTLITGANNSIIGSGNQNTIDIIAGCATSGIAAKLCSDLVLGGYSDWYLPSTNELNKLYLNKTLIGGFSNNFYWSSKQFSNNSSWGLYFNNGTLGTNYKNNNYYVRAIRSF
jgi:hypothetical protein